MNLNGISGAISEMVRALLIFTGRFSPNRRKHIDPSAGYERIDGFFLYVGTEGDVHYTDMEGSTGTEHFIVGYHPTQFKRIGPLAEGTTAGDLAACF